MNIQERKAINAATDVIAEIIRNGQLRIDAEDQLCQAQQQLLALLN